MSQQRVCQERRTLQGKGNIPALDDLNLRQDNGSEDQSGCGNSVAQAGRYGKDQAAMPFRVESSSCGEYSARNLFLFHLCTMDDNCYGNKRLTEKNRQVIKQTYSVCLNFICYSKYRNAIFMRQWEDGGKRETTLSPEKIILPCGTISVVFSLRSSWLF